MHVFCMVCIAIYALKIGSICKLGVYHIAIHDHDERNMCMHCRVTDENV